jgi:hypothetical protein
MIMLRTGHAVGIAGGSICLALIDLLIRKEILTGAEAREVLSAAQRQLSPFSTGIDDAGAKAAEACRIIGELFSGLPKDRT